MTGIQIHAYYDASLAHWPFCQKDFPVTHLVGAQREDFCETDRQKRNKMNIIEGTSLCCEEGTQVSSAFVNKRTLATSLAELLCHYLTW